MNGHFRLFPEQASSVAHEVDLLFLFLVAVSAFFTTLIAGSILCFAIRYRRSRSRRPGGSLQGIVKLEVLWTVGPLLLTLAMFAWGAELFFRVQTPPSGLPEIYVFGKQWMWQIEHPNGRREINELHVPVGRPVKLRLISEDVIHSFYVPAFRVKQDVLPGRYTTLWFEATKPGQFHLFCAEYCGTNHSTMIGRVVALPPSDYQRWLAGRLDEQPLATQGQWAFERFRCDSCHVDSGGVRRGPVLFGRFGDPVALAGGRTATFDEDYIRESILRPKQKIAAGYPAIMPTYEGQISEQEILAIIAYLKTFESPGGGGQRPVAKPAETTETEPSGSPAAKSAEGQ